MIRISTLIWLLLTVVTGTLLFGFGQKAETEKHKIAALDRKIGHEQETIDVLNAEWSYLTRPARLRELAEKHLDIKPVKRLPLVGRDEIMAMAPPPLESEKTEEPQSQEIVSENKDEAAFALSAPPPEPKPESPELLQTPEQKQSFEEMLKLLGAPE